MPALDAPPQAPPPLQPEVPPTVDALVAQIDDWVVYHLLCTFASNPHYENQLYGPLNIYLTSIFPISRRFMVIPQALLRRAIQAGDQDAANTSFGSTAEHESRNLPGVEHFKLIPDFEVVKVTPAPHVDMRRQHRIVCIIEVKKDDMTSTQAADQMADYMRQAEPHRRLEPLVGYLVMGPHVLKFVLRRHRNRPLVTYNHDEFFDMRNAGNVFTRDLCRIARGQWD
ncbi:hypothetical protein H0H92_009111 [Tricholoma furcatifolium]|nr:hypothetical protein H0H92_009111 [Tricholoma furcatifolium]